MAQRIGYGVSPPGKRALISDEQDDVDEVGSARVPLRRYIQVFVFIFAYTGFWFYWGAFVLINTQYTDGNPQLGTPGTSYLSARYNLWDWWPVWALGLNVLLPLSLAMAVADNTVEEWARLHRWFCSASFGVNIVVFLWLTVAWGVVCNNAYSGAHSACNDGRWCGVHYPSPWCPNNSPFTPPVSSGDLTRNQEMTTHWAFALVFLLLGTWHRSFNDDLREFGVLK